MADNNGFKIRVLHGSGFCEGFCEGVGRLYIHEDETIRFELSGGQRQTTSPPADIRNLMLCKSKQSLREILRTRTTWPVELNFSRLPVFLACALVLLMCPVPEALSSELPSAWILKGISVLMCFNYLLVVPLARLLVEFENAYLCFAIDKRVLDTHILPRLERKPPSPFLWRK